MKTSIFCIFCSIASVTFAQDGPQDVSRYLFHDTLIGVGYARSEAGAISTVGHVARTDFTSGGIPHGYYWAKTVNSGIPVPLNETSTIRYTHGMDISDKEDNVSVTEHIVGYGDVYVNATWLSQPIYWSTYTSNPVASPVSGWKFGSFKAIDVYTATTRNHVRAVGEARESSETGAKQAIWWEDGQQNSNLLDFPDSSGSWPTSEALDINRNGTIVGYVTDTAGKYYPCRWFWNSLMNSYDPAQILPGWTSLDPAREGNATAISEAETICGTTVGSGAQAFSYRYDGIEPQIVFHVYTDSGRKIFYDICWATLTSPKIAYRIQNTFLSQSKVYNDLDGIKVAGQPLAQIVDDANDSDTLSKWMLTETGESDGHLFAAETVLTHLLDANSINLDTGSDQNGGGNQATRLTLVKDFENTNLWKVGPGIKLNASDPDIVIKFGGQFGASNQPQAGPFSYQVSGRMSTGGVFNILLELYNYTTSSWDTVSGQVSIGNQWKSYVLNPVDYTKYIGGTNNVQGRVKVWKVFSATSSWTFDIDQVVFPVAPN